MVDTEEQTILLNAAIEDDYDNNGDDEEKKEDNVDGCMAFSSLFASLAFCCARLLENSLRFVVEKLVKFVPDITLPL